MSAKSEANKAAAERFDFWPPLITNPIKLRYSNISDLLREANAMMESINELNRMDWLTIVALREKELQVRAALKRLILDYIPRKDRASIPQFERLFAQATAAFVSSPEAQRPEQWMPKAKRDFLAFKRYLEVKLLALEALMDAAHEVLEMRGWYESRREALTRT